MTDSQDQDQALNLQNQLRRMPDLWLRFFQMTEEFFLQQKKYADSNITLINVLISIIPISLVNLIGYYLKDQGLEITMSVGFYLKQLGVPYLRLSLLLWPLVISLPLFYLIGSMVYFGSKAFGGEGDLGTQLYLNSLFIFPISLINAVLLLGTWIPVVGPFFSVMISASGIYTIILMVRSLKAVHGLTTLKAAGAYLIMPLFFFGIGCCLTFFVIQAV